MFDIQYLIKEWLDTRAILYPGIKHVLKEGMKIVTVSVKRKWDRLVTYWLSPSFFFFFFFFFLLFDKRFGVNSNWRRVDSRVLKFYLWILFWTISWAVFFLRQPIFLTLCPFKKKKKKKKKKSDATLCASYLRKYLSYDHTYCKWEAHLLFI